MTEAPVRCDVVVPVYNALRSTTRCLHTLRRFAPPWARIVVVNDGSDARTTEWLREQEGIVLLENPVNLGFVKTANRGLTFSDAPYVCLLNSDTLMTEGALERMVARLDADRSIGMCCPLSNGAVNLSVKLPPGEDVFHLARRVARTPSPSYPDAVTIVGFCLLVKREVIATLGVFDEIFDRGFCEETDFHYRARAAGWRCVVADDAFVYHRQGASFSDGNERTARNMQILMRRWRPIHERELAEFDRKNELGRLRDPRTFEWTLPDPEPEEPYDVLFVLPGLLLCGGVMAVLELVNALLLEGVRAGVVALLEMLPEADMEVFFRPLRIPAHRLAADLPPCRLLVATAYQTAPLVASLSAVRPGLKTAYYLQDYEGWFGGDSPEYVAGTYDLIPRMTSVSQWLANEVAQRHGHRPVTIPISADPDTFYPRGDRREAPVRIVAMLRAEERRGIHVLLPALAKVGEHPGVEIVLFGAHPVPPEAPRFPHRHVGPLSRDGVARLLSTAHVVVDPSLYQGFGLVGLEGMASGAAVVLTDSGGIHEYAVEGVNALIVPPKDPDQLAAAILRLVEDPALRERLAGAGLATARRFTWRRTALGFIDFMRSLPPAPELSPGERTALEFLGREVGRKAARDAPALAPDDGSAALGPYQGSRVLRIAMAYWRLKARFLPGARREG